MATPQAAIPRTRQRVPPVDTWAPEDVRRMIQFQHDLDASLVASGELVGAEGLAWPDQAKLVRDR